MTCSDRVRRTTAALVAVAALVAPTACGLAPSTPPGHAATVKGALRAFLLGCSLESAPRVVDQLNEPAQEVFAAAGDTLEGCEAVLPLDPDGKPSTELFGDATVASVELRGDRAHVVVRPPEGEPVRAELESSPPGEWRLRPTSADRAVVRGTLQRFLDACASADGTDAISLLTDEAKKRFLAADSVREGCQAVLPLAAPGKGEEKKDNGKKKHAEQPDRALFEDTELRSVRIRGDHADVVLATPDGETAHATLEAAAAGARWDVDVSPGRSGGT